MDVEVAEHLLVGSDGAAGQAAVAAVQDGDGEVARADEAVDGQADSARGQLKAEAELVPAGDGDKRLGGGHGEHVVIPKHHYTKENTFKGWTIFVWHICAVKNVF